MPKAKAPKKSTEAIFEEESQRMLKYPASHINIWQKIPEGNEIHAVYPTYESANAMRYNLYTVKKAILRTKVYNKAVFGDKVWRVKLSIKEIDGKFHLIFKLRGSMTQDADFDEAIKAGTGNIVENLPTNYTTISVDPTIDKSGIEPPPYDTTNPEPKQTMDDVPDALKDILSDKLRNKK